MPKERKPIATRLRSRDSKKPEDVAPPKGTKPAAYRKRKYTFKHEKKSFAQSSRDNSASFSPRTNPSIYLDELTTPLSDVRDSSISPMLSSKAASRRQVRHAGSFHELDVAPPIPSKRFIIKKKPRQNIDIHPKVENSEEQAKETERLAEELLSTSKPKKTTTAQRATRTSGDKPHVALSLIRSRTGGGGGGSGRGGAGAPRRTADLGRESLSVALPQDVPVLDAEALDDKEKEKEYWRRQRRMFARSRFITNEEAADVARRVYCNRTIPTNHRMVITFQANIANFRSKWRKLLKEIVKGLKIPKSLVTDGDNEALLREVRSKVDMDMLHAVWGHWISEPFVKVDAFYANTEAVDTLTEVTIKAIYITLRSLYGNLQEKDFRRELDDLDKWTRPMYLPDPLEGQV